MSAQAALVSAEMALAQAQAGLADYDVDLKRYESELAKIALEEAQLAKEDLEASLASAQIAAPFDGRITTISVSEGRLVEAYRPIMVIANLDIPFLDLEYAGG